MTKLQPLALAIGVALSASAQANTAKANTDVLDEITVVGKSVSFANSSTSPEMQLQQSSMTSALAVIDNLPGVLINEGDTFGADDWSTTVSIRGFQLSLDEQQIGITIDGIANGNSNYGGGAKANRFIDTENLAAVEVSQGTSDITSRSNEALGGTLNFTTIAPTADAETKISFAKGDFGAQKLFLRHNTGEIFDNTTAWFSVSSRESTDHMEGSAQNTGDHMAAKFVHEGTDFAVTGYASYDDVHEDNYQRVSLGEFNTNPDWDRLIGTWTGIPYVDQVHRRGWSTSRTNILGYLKLDYDVSSDLSISANAYVHENEGRGDWIPPYIHLVSDVNGGDSLAIAAFTDTAGNPVAPIDGCESSITFPYGGADAASDPGCYEQGAVPVSSFRNSNYEKSRIGLNIDAEYTLDEHTLRAGLWIEDYERKENRSWHKIIDSRVGFQADSNPYWVQYSNEFPVSTTMMYAEGEFVFDKLTARAGVKQFLVELEKKDVFANTTSAPVDSDSDLLMSFGAVYEVNDNLEVFAGYGENFAAIKDTVLERDASALENIEPETAENLDFGIRYSSDRVNASLTFYDITFENRLVFLDNSQAGQAPNYDIGTNGSFVNVGGIESSGIEASATVFVDQNWSLYASYTNNNSEYAGTLDAYPAGNTVFGSAEDMAVISIDYVKDNFFAGLSTKYVGKRFMDAANTDVIDAYTVGDFYAGMNIDSPVEGIQTIDMRLTVNNITDEDYIGGVSGGWGGWIGAPRTAVLNVSFTF